MTNSVTGTSTLTVGNGNTAGTFNGVIQDGGAGRIVALTKTGTNTQTLVGDSNYSGVTTISGGTLQVGSGGSTGSLGSGAVVNGAALVFDRSGSLTVANAISGSGSLTKSGPGEVVLSGANSYAGTTTLTAGTLRVGNGTSGSLASTPVTFSGPGRLSLEQAPDTAQSLGALTFSAGAGTVASVYPGSGTTSVTFGSLAARAAGATGNFVVTGGTNGSTNSIVLTGAATNALLGPGYFFNGSNYAWYDTAGFVRATTTGDAGFVTAPAGTTFGAVDPASNVNVTGGITAQPTATVNTVRLADAVAANNAVTVTTGNTLSLAGILKAGGNAGTIGGGTLTAATAGGEVVVRSDAAADTLTISSVIADNTSASRLTTTGDGRVILLATNTHSGGTTVASGTLQLGNGTTSGNLSGTTMIQPGAVLEVNPTGTGTGAANTLAGPLAGGGLLRKTGSGRVSLNQTSSSFTGNVEIEAGTLRISGVNNTSLGQKTSARTITVAAGATLESSANNPFGTNGDSAAVIPTLQINGTFLVSTSLATVGNVTLSGGTLDTRSGGAGLGILLNGNVTVTGSSKSTIIGTSGLVGLNRLSPFNSRFDVADVASGVDFEVLRSLANGGASPSNLIKAGPGTMLLGDTNTFTGTVTVEAGTLLINGATTSASAMTVQAGGTLGGSGSIGTAITGAGTVSPGNSAGIFTAPQFNGSGGLGAVFEFTGTSPTWSAATASVNDVLRLTDLTTPFPASLSAASEIDILFDIAGLPGSVPVAPGTYTGGFFTDLQTDFLSSISGGDFRYWVRGTFGGTQQSFDGVVYSPLSAFDPSLSVTLGTVPVTAGFAGGSINGQSMQLVVVPEPATLALAGIGLAALGWRVCRRR